MDKNLSLIKTLSLKSPKGVGHVRLIRIGLGDSRVDLQPCGGKHVKQIREIGRVRISKIEKRVDKTDGSTSFLIKITKEKLYLA